MKTLYASLALLLATCTSLPTLAAEMPSRITANYAVFKMGQQVGEAKEDWQRKGKTYTLVSETRATGVFAWFTKGSVKLISRGRITADGLQPLHFEHWRGNDPKRVVSADFDWNKHILTLKHDGQTTTETLPANLQDRISMMYQFMFMPHNKDVLTLQHTNGKSIITQKFNHSGLEKTMTGAGEMTVLHYSRVKEKDSKRTDFWLAPGKVFFPVRVEIEEKDGTLEQVLTRLTIK